MLLASALAILMITTLTNLYLKLNHAVLRNQQAISDSLAAARIITIMRSEIESAGHIGCAQLGDAFSVQSYQQYSLTKANSLQVQDNELVVAYQAMPTLSLLAPVSAHGTILTDDGLPITAKEILLISDCTHAEIFQVKSVSIINHVKHITATLPLHYTYGDNAELGRFMRHHYYLRTHGNRTELIEEDTHGEKNRLQTEVTNLQFQADSHGVAYSFNYKNEIWSGYATD